MSANSLAEVKKRFPVAQRVEAQAKRAIGHGLFFDVDGVEGFVHVLDWGPDPARISKNQLGLVVGQTVLVEVLDHSEGPNGEGRLQLSRKACLDEALARLEPGDRVRGKIRSVNAVGAAALVRGLDGMISKHDIEGEIDETFAVGDEVDFEVLATSAGRVLLKPAPE